MSAYTSLIQPAELTALADADVLLVDCRFDLGEPGKGEREYRAGHLAGAVYAHLDRDLSGPAQPALGRHPLPAAAGFSSTLSRWGWRPGLQLVAYDAAAGALAAARLWWLARLAGIAEVAVLDGGFAAAQAAGLPIDAAPSSRLPSQQTLRYQDRQMLDHAALQQRLAEPTSLLLDARAAPRYRGEVEPIDAIGGHVPGARNRPFADNLRADGRFKSPERLREEFGLLLGARAPADVVHMCGSGVTACHNLLAMEYAGLGGSLLYPPSWSGWISNPARPRATG